jgi:hypothetical protein
MISDVTEQEVADLIAAYKLELKKETMASPSVRRMWQIVVLALEKLKKDMR